MTCFNHAHKHRHNELFLIVDVCCLNWSSVEFLSIKVMKRVPQIMQLFLNTKIEHLKPKHWQEAHVYLHVNRKHVIYCLHVLVYRDSWVVLEPRPN